MGNPKKPPTGEIDVSLRKFVDQCWTHHLRRPGPPAVQRYGNLVRLALMPIGDYAIDSAPGGASALYRFRPVIRRLRAALAPAQLSLNQPRGTRTIAP